MKQKKYRITLDLTKREIEKHAAELYAINNSKKYKIEGWCSLSIIIIAVCLAVVFGLNGAWIGIALIFINYIYWWYNLGRKERRFSKEYGKEYAKEKCENL